MKKRFLSIAICFCLMIASLFTFAACGESKMTVSEANDKMEPMGTPINALMNTFYSNSFEPAEEAIIETAGEALESAMMFGEIPYMLANYKELNEDMKESEGIDFDFVTKKGNTYTITMDDVTTIEVESSKNSITLNVISGEGEEAETSVCTFSFAKNFVRIDAEAFGATVVGEIKLTETDMYLQLYTVTVEGEGEEAVTSYAVIEMKTNYTLTEEEFEGETFETATINSFAIFAEETEVAPTSIKSVEDFSEYATGEGAVAWEATVA